MSGSKEKVILSLRNVVFTSDEKKSLEEFLTEKYGFKKREEAISDLTGLESEFEPPAQFKNLKILEKGRRKTSCTILLTGQYLEENLTVYFLGEVMREKYTVQISETEKKTIHINEYQMIRIEGFSGKAVQEFTEHLRVQLGLSWESMDWSFHKEAE
ncbi:MAG: hypothetical protein OdinLCB4_007170 [Candidatus Odinarchaeum yellowstonii]|jgi:hypothetical protein|uniref:Uncharacterized protein n=1 Tax=Odinarchaeota yellowstonii (strain LCB_4) TaxID=1841599 RepID=A0AAF0IBS8_ODILC|nr:MAG: hypothetical protein OdinLCB4_007170 [Candidatus Odinarchaeum yellowstonii]